ncbi:N-formylglutamate amidohydrolase [Salegentibacter salegens]|uniref:Predicted N-formylglutamate amidohydrolase n=1 Tax=Salegentibacter salegens TaxID=143223 RepID=A0A1M7IVV7_9FLAO|nr:N-formylglutamate amidohydrolase [Salegentibacter salegens]PRX49825.1 putative N-formylglutamate amidohydrolase [Salegentibacter salegens]SHM44836.1 Predicted N-formylglutamate amidohydrolase [Salegentibacter salegens]
MKLVLTCEHAFNRIPKEYNDLFLNAEDTLNSHRGYDPGALDLFKELKVLADFKEFQQTGRLLVEVNRSKGHPNLFSEFTGKISLQEKTEILENYYFPYRNSIEKAISAFIREGEKVLHFSVHTFTPELNGIIRNTEIGLLYDPARPREKEFSKKFKQNLKNQNPELKIRFNYPYLGRADGFTTYLRKKFPDNYIGIELEVNQKFVHNNKMDSVFKKQLFTALKASY